MIDISGHLRFAQSVSAVASVAPLPRKARTRTNRAFTAAPSGPWIHSAQIRFDCRNLLAAAFDSCRPLTSLHRDHLECAAVTIEHGTLPRVVLEAVHDAVGVFGIDFHEACAATAALAGD